MRRVTSRAPGTAAPDDEPRRRFGRLRRQAERGVSLVEYALLVALLVVPTIGAINLMKTGAQAKISTTAVGISSHPIPTVP